MNPLIHHPHLYSSRLGAWCHCACGGWKSTAYTTVSGAHIAFGRHLLDTNGAAP